MGIDCVSNYFRNLTKVMLHKVGRDFFWRMISKIETDLVSRSFGRCLAFDNVLFDRFYTYFFQSNPRIPEMFRNTEMSNQKKLLRAGINYSIMYCTDAGAMSGKMALSRIKDTHSQARMNIPPDLYSFWIESLIKALEVTDPKFTPEIKQAWVNVLNKSVDFIKAGFYGSEGRSVL